MTTPPLSTDRSLTHKAASAANLSNAEAAPTLYDRDYLAWVETTLQSLNRKDYDSVDWDNLIEELSDMSRSEKRRLKSNLVVVLLHLLKWQYQAERRSRSWAASIAERRRRIIEALETSPSLKPLLLEVLQKSYTDSLKQAAIETGLSKDIFPVACPYAIAQILDDNFLPE